MDCFVIRSGDEVDRRVPGNRILTTLTIDDETLSVSLGEGEKAAKVLTSQLWSHTVFELVQLSEALRVVGQRRVPANVVTKSRTGSFGPESHLRLGIQIHIGMPPIGTYDPGTLIYISRRKMGIPRRTLMELEAMNELCSERIRMECSDAVRLADELDKIILRLGPRLVHWGVDPDDESDPQSEN